MHLTDEELQMISAQGSLSVFRNGDNGAIIVHQISGQYTAEPERIVFNQDFWTNADISSVPPYSSADVESGVVQKETQVHRLYNDFLPNVEGMPVLDVPETVTLGREIIIHWTADRLGGRLSHKDDWVALYKQGECTANKASMIIPDPEQLINQNNYVNKCYLQAAALGLGDAATGTVRFQPDAYRSTAGVYEVRYFLGDSRDGNGYVCRSMPGTVHHVSNCLLHAQTTSNPIIVVKTATSESLDSEQLPGLETFQDADDGAMYASAIF
jgi:hypothetical protein